MLADLIDKVLRAPDTVPAIEGLPGRGGLIVLRRLEQEVARLVPSSESVILLDENRLGVFGFLSGRRCAPFLERNGVYWGNPADAAEAIRELERMRDEGHTHLVLMATAQWWLDYYRGFAEFLGKGAEPVYMSDAFTIYRLLPGAF